MRQSEMKEKEYLMYLQFCMSPTHLIPQTSQGHQRPLGDEDERGGRGLLQDSAIHWPQPREDPEEGGLATPVRSSYEDVLAGLKGERETWNNDISVRRHDGDPIQHKLIGGRGDDEAINFGNN